MVRKFFGVIGFIMLFAVPTEETSASIALYLVWLAAALALLLYAGAFRSKKQTTPNN